MNNIETRILYTKDGYIYRAYSIGFLTRQKLPKNDKYYTEEPIQWFLTKDGVPVIYLDGKAQKVAYIIADAFKPMNIKRYKIEYLDGNKANVNYDNMQLIPTDAKNIAESFGYQVVEKKTGKALGVYSAKQMETIFGLNAGALNAYCDGLKPSILKNNFKYDIFRVSEVEDGNY